jgi:hypothetical protein
MQIEIGLLKTGLWANMWAKLAHQPKKMWNKEIWNLSNTLTCMLITKCIDDSMEITASM